MLTLHALFMKFKNYCMLACFVVYGLTTNTSYAHAILVKSSPAKDSVLSAAPNQVDLWFDDKVGSEFKALAVIDSAGKRMDNKDVQQELFNEAHLYATLQPLVPGNYTVRYRVVSIDTHIVTGKFQFTVKAP